MVMLVFPLLLGTPVGYLPPQARLLACWRGWFGVGAALLLLGWGGWGALFVRDITRDPASHNLFPFESLIGAAVALPHLDLLAVARRLCRGLPAG